MEVKEDHEESKQNKSYKGLKQEDYNYIMGENNELKGEWLNNFRQYFLEKVGELKQIGEFEKGSSKDKVCKNAQNYLKDAFFTKMIIKYKDKIFTSSEQEHFNFAKNENNDLEFSIKKSDDKSYTKEEEIIMRKINRFYNMLAKLTHTSRVVKDTNQMLKGMKVEGDLNEKGIVKQIILYAALYHDIGRFYEAARYDLFGNELIANEPKVNLAASNNNEFDHAIAGYWYGLSDDLDYDANMKELNEDDSKNMIIKSIGAIIVMLHQQSNSNLRNFDVMLSEANIKDILKTQWSNINKPERKFSLEKAVRYLYKYASSNNLFMSENKDKRIIENTDNRGKVDIGSSCVKNINEHKLAMEKSLENIIKLGLHIVMGADRIDILRQWSDGTYPGFENLLNPRNITIDLCNLIDANNKIGSQKTLGDVINEFIGIEDEEKQRKIAFKIISDAFETSEEEKIQKILNTNMNYIFIDDDRRKDEKGNIRGKLINCGWINSKRSEKITSEIPVSDLRPYTDEEIIERFILGGEERFNEFIKNMSRKSLNGIKYTSGILGLLWNINQFVFVNARTRAQLETIKEQGIINKIRETISSLNPGSESKISGEAIAKASEKYFDFTNLVLDKAVNGIEENGIKILPPVPPTFKHKDMQKIIEKCLELTYKKSDEMKKSIKMKDIQPITKGIKTSDVKEEIDGVRQIVMVPQELIVEERV